MGVDDSKNWTFQTRDGNHIVTAKVEHDFWGNCTFSATYDGMQIAEVKKLGFRGLWGIQQPVRIGSYHTGIIKVLKKFNGAKLEMAVNGRQVLPNQHIVLEEPAPQSPPQPVSPPAPAYPPGDHKSSQVPMVPVLPNNCQNCGSPISMESVQWTGPMTARCSSCSSGIEVQWQKLGE